MTLIIIFLLVVVVVFAIAKSLPSKKEEHHREPKTERSYIHEEYEETQQRQATVRKREDGAFVLSCDNQPRVTIIGATEEQANSIATLSKQGPYDAAKPVRNVLLEHELQVAEVNNFQKRVRPIVEERVKNLIAADEEWETLGEMDRKDKLAEYENQSMVTFGKNVSPALVTDLTYLTWNSPHYVPLLKDLIREYGVANLNTYCEYFGRKHPVISIPNSKYRKPLEDLVKAGLAYTGSDMCVEELLSSLTLNELNEISGVNTKFTRKDKAIQFISEKDNVTSIIEKHIALRSLFALKPLPTRFQGFDFDGYRELLSYYDALAGVVISLYCGLSTISYK